MRDWIYVAQKVRGVKRESKTLCLVAIQVVYSREIMRIKLCYL